MGFDYLRDNMVIYQERAWCSAAITSPSWTRWTPSSSTRRARRLIISGTGDKSTELYDHGGPLCPQPCRHGRRPERGRQGGRGREMIDADYVVDEKAKTATLTAPRHRARPSDCFNVENLSDPENTTICRTTSIRLSRARGLMKRDVDYVVQGRRGHHRRRVHRPSDVSAAATTTVCTRPSRPRKHVTVAAREQDAGHHHLPELLPPVQQALRHDRYGQDRGGGVQAASIKLDVVQIPTNTPDDPHGP